jgi:hypothetical protein
VLGVTATAARETSTEKESVRRTERETEPERE